MRQGVEARLVDVEVDVASQGVTSYRVSGLPAVIARSMEQRVLSALRNSGVPSMQHPVTVNFAPSALPKEGAPLDLALAVALLAGMGLAPASATERLVAHGELSLDGAVRPVPGALAVAEAARAAGIPALACAAACAREAAAVEGLIVHPIEHLTDAIELLEGVGPPGLERTEAPATNPGRLHGLDLSDVRGQLAARRALELAAAGGHGLLLVGPPGSGKSMLARRLPGILPPLLLEEALEVTRIHSAAGLLLGRAGGTESGLVAERPFRAPHHGISSPGLIGGGRLLLPGEATLAHRGVLFLDEMPELRRDALEGLRQPLEDGYVSLVRVHGRAVLPCRFLLAAAMNPCPCGWLGATVRTCTCGEGQIARYRSKVSGPLLDRLDLQVEVPALSFAELSAAKPGERSAAVRERVLGARQRQLARFGRPNAELSPTLLRELVSLEPAARLLLAQAVDRFGLSGRAHDRVLRVALTIRDVAKFQDNATAEPECVTLAREHVAEALSYRALDPAGAPPRAARIHEVRR